MADGGRDRCFEDVVCILFNDENRATVVVSTVIQLLQPPLSLWGDGATRGGDGAMVRWGDGANILQATAASRCSKTLPTQTLIQ